MPNKLVGSTGPYLLQHQNNPVYWYPWGNEALQKAKLESKPIFLSIVYAGTRLLGLVEGRGLVGDASLVLYQCSHGTCRNPEIL